MTLGGAHNTYSPKFWPLTRGDLLLIQPSSIFLIFRPFDSVMWGRVLFYGKVILTSMIRIIEFIECPISGKVSTNHTLLSKNAHHWGIPINYTTVKNSKAKNSLCTHFSVPVRYTKLWHCTTDCVPPSLKVDNLM